jgi:hypothetical protein
MEAVILGSRCIGDANEHLPLHTLHRTRTDANELRHLQNAMPGVQMLADGFLDIRANLGTPQLLALLSWTGEGDD